MWADVFKKFWEFLLWHSGLRIWQQLRSLPRCLVLWANGSGFATAEVWVEAVAWIQSLAQELPYAVGTAIKKKKNFFLFWKILTCYFFVILFLYLGLQLHLCETDYASHTSSALFCFSCFFTVCASIGIFSYWLLFEFTNPTLGKQSILLSLSYELLILDNVPFSSKNIHF